MHHRACHLVRPAHAWLVIHRGRRGRQDRCRRCHGHWSSCTAAARVAGAATATALLVRRGASVGANAAAHVRTRGTAPFPGHPRRRFATLDFCRRRRGRGRRLGVASSKKLLAYSVAATVDGEGGAVGDRDALQRVRVGMVATGRDERVEAKDVLHVGGVLASDPVLCGVCVRASVYVYVCGEGEMGGGKEGGGEVRQLSVVPAQETHTSHTQQYDTISGSQRTSGSASWSLR